MLGMALEQAAQQLDIYLALSKGTSSQTSKTPDHEKTDTAPQAQLSTSQSSQGAGKHRTGSRSPRRSEEALAVAADAAAKAAGEIPCTSEQIHLQVVSYNATSWKVMKEILAIAEMMIVLAQETHVLKDKIDEASAWAYRRGWTSFWQPAAPGLSSHSSRGGVAIVVRSFLAARPLEMDHAAHGAEALEGRQVAALVQIPGHKDIAVMSMYLQDSSPISSLANTSILANAG